jgi:COP9 signalosome complex subunit 6
MLHSRIGVILQYLSNVHKGVIPADHETLRQISALVSSISATSPDAKDVDTEGSFAAEFEQEQNDVLLTTILGQMTRNLESTNVLMDKFGITQQRGEDDIMMGPGGGRKGGGGGKGGFRGGAGNRRGTSDFGFF